MLSAIKRAIFFAAHTDDEMICAGTLHRLVKQGTDLRMVAFGSAAIESDRLGTKDSESVTTSEWINSCIVIGVEADRREFLRLRPSRDLHTYSSEIRQIIYTRCEQLKPDAVFTLSPEDENPAHAVVGRETEAVTRGRVPITIRCQFPWNYGLGRPNLYVRLSQEDAAVKRAVIRCYQSQEFRYKYEDMLMGYARADGLSVKAEHAEKFELIRGVV